jgi:hypothetical protein
MTPLAVTVMGRHWDQGASIPVVLSRGLYILRLAANTYEAESIEPIEDSERDPEILDIFPTNGPPVRWDRSVASRPKLPWQEEILEPFTELPPPFKRNDINSTAR